MDMELKELCEKLKQLSKSIKMKAACENFFKYSEDEYVEENVQTKKPVLKQMEPIAEPKKPAFTKKQTYILLVIGFLCMIMQIPLVFISDFAEVMYIGIRPFILPALSFIIIISSLVLGAKVNIYEEKIKKYNDIIIQNKKNEEENNHYPELLKRYEEDIINCKNVYKKKCLEKKKLMQEAEKEIEKFGDIINPKFYPNIDDIIEILEDGRADSLKEAINIFVSDSIQKELVKEQQKMNEITEQQRLDAQRHNMAMEEQARRQSDSIKQQEEARRRGALNCWQCKNFPCGGDPAYCGSFVKKQ